MRGAQLLPRLDAATLAAQPLPVEQVRAGELGRYRIAAESLDRFAIELFGRGVAKEQRPATGFDAGGPVGTARLRRIHQPLEGVASEPSLTHSNSRFHELR